MPDRNKPRHHGARYSYEKANGAPPWARRMAMRRSAELAGVAGIERGRIAILETLDFAATCDGDAVAYLPFDGRLRRARCLGGGLFLGQLESEQCCVVLHGAILE